MIFVVAKIQLQPGCREKFLEEFRKIVPLVRKEEGCIEYEPTIDAGASVGGPSPVGPDAVVVVEKWETIEHLEKHLVAPHMIEYRRRVQEMVKATELMVLKPAS